MSVVLHACVRAFVRIIIDVLCVVHLVRMLLAVFTPHSPVRVSSIVGDILTPAILDTKRDQNSIILIRKGFLKCPAVEITAAVLQSPPNSSSIFNPGDVAAFVCMSVSGQQLLIGSFLRVCVYVCVCVCVCVTLCYIFLYFF